MISAFRWLLATEALNIVGIPLAFLLLRRLPDRGYAFSRVIALVALTWLVWLLGFVVPVANSAILAWVLVLGGGVAAWVLTRSTTWTAIRQISRIVVIEEGLFLGAFIVWTVVRALHPDITGTEKPMDLMLLQSATHSVSSPPQDLWLAGQPVNYYYFGYLAMAMVGRLAGIGALEGFNLSLACIFALAISGTYALGLALTGRRLWAATSPLFVVLLGNAHGLFNQVLHGEFPWNQTWWFWESSRVVGQTSPGSATTINEFPMFSFVLGDLHPHLLALPIALASLAFAAAFLFEMRLDGRISAAALVVGGVVTGSLFATNSWDYPTYLLVGLMSIAIGFLGYRRSAMAADRRASDLVRPIGRGCLLFVGSGVLAFAPFWLTYHSPTHGIGRVTTPTSVQQFATIFGFFGFFAILLVSISAWQSGALRRTVFRVRATIAEAGESSLSVRTIAVSAIVIGCCILALLHLWVLVAALLVGGTALYVNMTVELSERDSWALVAITVGALLIALTEVVYLRDAFDGGAFYRMNTVFKAYFQAWILLGIGASYGIFRVLAQSRLRPAMIGLVASCALAGVLIAGVYTVFGPLSYYTAQSGSGVSAHLQPLDGMETLEATDPEDAHAVAWLASHISGQPTILEATGGEYSNFARVSIFAGLPIPLGWEGHELQWRGSNPLIGARHALVDQIYSTGSAAAARKLIVSNHIGLVYVGPCERQVYGLPGSADAGTGVCGSATPVPASKGALTKFRRFMSTVYRRDGVTIYQAHP